MMNVIYAGYERSLFTKLTNALDEFISVFDLQKLICAYAKESIADITILILSDIRVMKFEIAHFRVEVCIRFESCRMTTPPCEREEMVVFTTKEMEIQNGDETLIGYSSCAWSIDHAIYNFNADNVACVISGLIKFGYMNATSAKRVRDLGDLTRLRTCTVGEMVIAECTMNAKKMGWMM